MDEPTSPAASPAAAPRRRGRRIALALLVPLVAMLALGLGAAGFVGWALRSEPGSAWLLSVLPGVQVEAPQGTLLGDFAARRATIALPGGDRFDVSDLGWRGLRLERAAAPLWGRVVIESLSARRVDVVLAPAQGNASPGAPTSLRLPVELDLRRLRIAELHAAALGDRPLRELSAQLHLGAGAGAEHRVEQLSLQWDRLRAAGRLRIASAAPLALDASLALAQQAAESLPAWDA
ncbi:MAG TPA: hypothetical protein VNU71_06940, partial [Burkholderiaceae bacterium]|nr:hypothetical protein [Burkholderiaceae bacterium]